MFLSLHVKNCHSEFSSPLLSTITKSKDIFVELHAMLYSFLLICKLFHWLSFCLLLLFCFITEGRIQTHPGNKLLVLHGLFIILSSHYYSAVAC